MGLFLYAYRFPTSQTMAFIMMAMNDPMIAYSIIDRRIEARIGLRSPLLATASFRAVANRIKTW
jgi:hypothetical protein